MRRCLLLALTGCLLASCNSTNVFNIMFHDLNINIGGASTQPGGSGSPPASQPSGPPALTHCVDLGNATVIVIDVNPVVNHPGQPLPSPAARPTFTIALAGSAHEDGS